MTLTLKEREGRRHDEDELQKTTVDLLRKLAKPSVYWTAINPGGNKLSRATAGRFKAMGVRAGCPDLSFVLEDGKAAFIELKSGTGRLSEAQGEFQSWCIRQGVPFAIVTDMDQALAVLNHWRVLKGRPE